MTYPKLTIELGDGSIIVGTWISFSQTNPHNTLFPDGSIYEIPHPLCTLSVLSDTLGKLDISAQHIVRIGTDPEHLTEIKNPLDILFYIQPVLDRHNTNA